MKKFASSILFCVVSLVMSFTNQPSNLALSKDVQDVRYNLTFESQLKVAIDDMMAKVQVDPELKGHKFRLGAFRSDTAPDSNYELAICSVIQKQLGNRIDPSSEFVLCGSYDLVIGKLREHQGLKILQVKLQILNADTEPLQTVTKEVNDPADVARVLGTTISELPQQKPAERLANISNSQREAMFSIVHQTQVAAGQRPDLTVEIVRHSNTRNIQPITIANVDGKPFVDLDLEDRFAVIVRNNSSHDMVAHVSIDGLSVINEFNEDRVRYPGYFVGKNSQHIVWGWLRTIKEPIKNVYAFKTNCVGQGAATQRGTKGSRGVITVEFYALANAISPRGSQPLEIATGELIDVGFRAKHIAVDTVPSSIVSVRYNH